MEESASPDPPDVSSFEIKSNALAAMLTGAQRNAERLFRHRERIHPGLPHPRSPVCPWCDAGVEEDHHHLFGECDAFADLRTPRNLKIRAVQAPFHDPSVAQWKKNLQM